MHAAELEVRQWLERVVIGMNLCPFAATPYRNGLIRITVSTAVTELDLLDALRAELERLDATPASGIETTLIVVTDLLAEFDDYNIFLDEVDFLLRRNHWEGEYQVASFHPDYQFEGTTTDDPGNLTNCSPWPILHIIREASMDQALSEFTEPGLIPERNIQKMRSLSSQQLRDYFPWRFADESNLK